MNFKQIVVIGCGGIWSYLWKPAARMLEHTKGAPKRLALVDGDHFTPSNAVRQDMIDADLMRNKAAVYVERFAVEFPTIKVSVIPEFVTKKNIEQLIPDGSLVLSCVDNHATRRLIAEHARKLKNCTVVTGASDMTAGNIHVQIIEEGKVQTKGIDETHDEVKNGKDRNPGELSCEERAKLPGGGQQMVANVMTASIMSVAMWKLMSGEEIIPQSEIFYDLKHMAMDSSGRSAVK